MERIFNVGQPVIYVDEHALPRPALITAIYGDEYEHEGVMHSPV